MIDRNDLLDVSAGTNNSLMLRSNSIGNLKYNAVTSADRFNAAPALLDNSHNITFSGFNDET
jgi:hypothetical protein